MFSWEQDVICFKGDKLLELTRESVSVTCLAIHVLPPQCGCAETLLEG